jgi:hypothetical protein
MIICDKNSDFDLAKRWVALRFMHFAVRSSLVAWRYSDSNFRALSWSTLDFDSAPKTFDSFVHGPESKFMVP